MSCASRLVGGAVGVQGMASIPWVAEADAEKILR